MQMKKGRVWEDELRNFLEKQREILSPSLTDREICHLCKMNIPGA
jgi:hypothetical protein